MNSNPENSVFYTCLLFGEYITSKIVGLSPWMTKISNKFDRNRVFHRFSEVEYELSVGGTFYNILLMIFYLVFDVLIVYDHFNIKNQTVQASITEYLAFISIICISAVVLIYIIRQKLLITVKNRFYDVDETLHSCTGYELERDNTNYWIFIVNILINCCYVICRLVFMYPITVILSMNIPTFVSSILMIQYTISINMMKNRFTSINTTLSKLGSSSHETILKDIRNIKRAYVELCDMCDNMADFYGIPTLIVILTSSLRNISSLYFLILIFLRESEMNNSLYLAGLFAIQTAFLFTTLTTSVTKIMQQNAETTRIINRLLDRFVINEEITNYLSHFANDMWHMKVEFTLCDIVPLDRTLLAIVSGTTVTYLIIAVQFHLNKPD